MLRSSVLSFPFGLSTRYTSYEFTTPSSIIVPDRPIFKAVERSIPSSSFSRAWNFAKMGSSVIGSTMLDSIKTGFRGSIKEHAISPKNIETLAEGLLKMRGAALKIGQFLSFQEGEGLPPEILEAFERTRREAYIMPKAQLQLVMEGELGNNWLDTFDSFEMMPFAAASIGQVHRAVYQGKKVAVKVQYPGVDTSIQSDLANLKRLLNWTNVLPKSLHFGALADHMKQDLINECDYNLEASHQTRFRELLKDDPRYCVPQVMSEISSKKVLVTEFLDSLIFEDFAALGSQDTRDLIGTCIMDLTLREIFEFRFMQTDPNPANFQYNQEKNTLDILDFGATKEYPDEFMDLYQKVVTAGVHCDKEAAVKYSSDLGYFVGDEDPQMFKAHANAMLIVGEPFRYQGLYDFGTQDITSRVFQEIKVMMKFRKCPPPPETYTLHRKLSGAYLMCMKLKAKINTKMLFEKYV